MQKETEKTKKGFTIIEVMLVLAIAGLMLVGVLGNTYSSIKAQRYNDAVTSFAEDLRKFYNEVLNPRSRNEESGASDTAIYGKVLLFNKETPNEFWTATLIGDTDLDEKASDTGFIQGLRGQGAGLACETLSKKNLYWEAQAMNNADPMDGYTGTIVIARSPRSGAIHTAMVDGSFGITDEESCNNMGNNNFMMALNSGAIEVTTEPITFCIKSDESSIVRAVQIAADGTNSSAVSVLNEDESREAGCK